MSAPPRDDLLALLRAVDERLAAVEPGPHVEARLREKLRASGQDARGRDASRAAWKLRRPLALALVACGIAALGASVFTPDERRAAAPTPSSSAPEPALSAPAGEPIERERPAEPHPPRPRLRPNPF